jgi:hypothetical protein
MPAWDGRQYGSRFATSAGIAGYRRRRTQPIVLRRSVGQLCGIREAWTAGRGQRGSRLGAAASQGVAKTNNARTLQAGFASGAQAKQDSWKAGIRSKSHIPISRLHRH